MIEGYRDEDIVIDVTFFDLIRITNVKNGNVIKRRDDGSIWKEANYLDDKLDGDYKIYDTNGVLMTHTTYRKGKPIIKHLTTQQYYQQKREGTQR
jgi:hypothetical protein